MEEPGWPSGRVVAVRDTAKSASSSGPRRLERGPLAVSIVVEDLPLGDLPGGARLRLGTTAVVVLGERRDAAQAGSAGSGARGGGLLEAIGGLPVSADVLDPGEVAPGDVVSLEAIAVPATDVLDLHSFRPRDVEQVVTAYLAEAHDAGLVEVRIVHGRGHGVQRAIVRRLLSGAPSVAAFADAPPERGGWGATVVRLRRPGEPGPT